MKINQLKAGVILSYVSQTLTILIGLIYTPVMLKILGQGEYGLYQLSASVISYLGLLSFGFGSSYIRYWSKYKTSNDEDGIASLNGMFMIVFAIIGLLCIVFGSILIANIQYIFKDSLTAQEIHKARILMGFMVFNLAVSFLGNVYISNITANERYLFQRIVAILQSIVNPLLAIPILLLGYKSVGIVIVQTLVTLAGFLTNAVYCKKSRRIKFDFRHINASVLREIFIFSFWIFVNLIIDQINWNVDKLILGIFHNTATVAVYSVAAQINMLYLNFSMSISAVFIPKINKIAVSSENDSLLTELFIRVGRIQFIVLALILSGLIIFGQYFISIWAGNGYGDAYAIMLLLTIPITISAIQNLGIEIQRAKNMHKLRSIIYLIMAVINIIMTIPLAKYYGGIGAAVGTAFSYIVGNGLIMNIFYHKKIGLNILQFWKQILKFIPSLILPIAAGVVIHNYIHISSVEMFVLLIAVYTVIYAISMWLFGMNESEKMLIIKPARSLLGRG